MTADRIMSGAALFLVWLLAAGVASPAAESPPPLADANLACLDEGVVPAAPQDLVRQAVRVLARSGHDPADYRVALRREDELHPDVPSPAPRLVTSVVFIPWADDHYRVRVHPAHPCAIGWVWDEAGATAWQRETIARAADVMKHRDRTWDAEGVFDVQVEESRTRLRIRFWREANGALDARTISAAVTLDKPSAATP